MIRRRTFVVALALAGATACDTDVTAPVDSPSPVLTAEVAAAGPSAVQPCTGPGEAVSPPPGWPRAYGTAGSDKLVSTADYAIRIDGRAGDDCLIGNQYNNSLFGDEGDDFLYGRLGRDYLSGGPGADFLSGGPGDDDINASDGESDVVRAGEGDDHVYAVDGAVDEIDCGAGTDMAWVDPDDVVRNCEIVNPW